MLKRMTILILMAIMVIVPSGCWLIDGAKLDGRWEGVDGKTVYTIDGASYRLYKAGKEVEQGEIAVDNSTIYVYHAGYDHTGKETDHTLIRDNDVLVDKEGVRYYKTTSE